MTLYYIIIYYKGSKYFVATCNIGRDWWLSLESLEAELDWQIHM